ncbi:hypothetical protein [Microvirga aerophila]|uniref:Uncharacterized protein n=1 Tax=Microvirga aerophila TaxID=670291 RepID=A0A512BSI4_9HYPH|nr:hypothetical protein [Microvirga aerophila]GEO14960.1 hypothetical protein MAE02_26560 [Microvirga aerophila]
MAPSVDFLAPALVAAADLQAIVGFPDTAIMGMAIARWCGRRTPTDLSPDDLAELDLPDLVAAMRPGSSPQACVDRLRRAALARKPRHAGQDIPRIEVLSGLGEAKD